MSRAWSGGIGAKMRQACVGFTPPRTGGDRRPDARRELRRRNPRAFDFDPLDVVGFQLREQPVQLPCVKSFVMSGARKSSGLRRRAGCLALRRELQCKPERDLAAIRTTRGARADVHVRLALSQIRASAVYIRSRAFAVDASRITTLMTQGSQAARRALSQAFACST